MRRRLAPLFRIGRIATSVMVLLIPSAVHAARITYNFSGVTTTDRIDGISSGSSNIPGGIPFSGSLIYDPQLPMTGSVIDAGDGSTSASYGSHPWGRPFSADDPNATMNIGGLPSFATGSPSWGNISIRNDEPPGWPTPIRADIFSLGVGDPNGHWVAINLVDPTGQALASTALPSTLDLAKFSHSLVEYQSEAGLMAGHITSLEVAAVPEPSVLAVLALGGLGLAVARSKARGRRPIG